MKKTVENSFLPHAFSYCLVLLALFPTVSLEAGQMKKINYLGTVNPAPAQIAFPPLPILPTAPPLLPLPQLALPTHPPLLNNDPQSNDGNFLTQRALKKRTHLNLQDKIFEETIRRIRFNYSFSNFKGTTFDTEFKKCVLSSVSFIEATLKGRFIKSKIQRSLFKRANLSNLYAEDTDFSHSSFSYLQSCHGAEYLGCTFFMCQFIKANLSKSVFSRSTFKEANFTHALLTESIFDQTDFSYANLNNANLSYSNFSNVDFTHANLSHATLRNTDLLEANLSHANLSGTVFFKSDLRGANLTNALLDGTSFLDALINKDTKGDITSMIAFGAHFVEEDIFTEEGE